MPEPEQTPPLWRFLWLHSLGAQKGARAWAWRRFTASVDVPEGAKEVELVCKAIDEGYNSQPDDFAAIYNFRGIVANAWQRVKLGVEQ